MAIPMVLQMSWTSAAARVRLVGTDLASRGGATDVHHPPDTAGHIRYGVLNALARLVGGNGRAGAGRQRLRRGRGPGFRPARRGTAPERPWRRSADHPGPGRRSGAGALRAGPGPRRGER